MMLGNFLNINMKFKTKKSYNQLKYLNLLKIDRKDLSYLQFTTQILRHWENL